ncbi:unnamed protein product, partial [Rotaria socialis]
CASDSLVYRQICVFLNNIFFQTEIDHIYGLLHVSELISNINIPQSATLQLNNANFNVSIR